MAVLDAVIYLAVGCVLDRFFGPKTLQSSISYCASSGEKAGVSIVNVSKVYGEGTRRRKVALDNVSIELHQGQVTTLLGHNGAGKTTLINILTGMTRPTRGHVTVRSGHAGTRAGTRAGVCPQHDVLFECLTAEEHIALYAQLKSGLPLEMLRDEIDYMLQVLSLGPVSQEPVYRLSGGTRRRLCVALAFVAKPQLVSLDEPTAGVDPAARRDIWSMIVKLREDRTILLTTHHLDEAELLSDQIVIMHKGQVHTTGSPIDIKRTLGNGYKLCVTYPRPEPWAVDEGSLEEKTKQLLTAVREDVRNAALVDVSGADVEIMLPFFDPNGLNNDFLRVCTSLESRQQQLGFSGYSMDCSSLEQVFHNICHDADADTPHQHAIEYESPSKSASTSSVRSDNSPLVPAEGPLRGSSCQQFLALLHARYLHYSRNRWLLFLLIVLPSLFVATAMGFSMIRPPPDNEVSLRLTPGLYEGSTDYLVSQPSVYSDVDPGFAQRVLESLKMGKQSRDWTAEDTPNCTCTETKQVCEQSTERVSRPQMMVVPGVSQLNRWLVASHDSYIEKRYGGYSAALKHNKTHLVAWYNNKGHHAMPAHLNALHSAILRVVSGDSDANITVYSHPLKISEEQLSKDTVYQHIADAGISALVVLAYSLVTAGGAVFLVSARASTQRRTQLLCGLSPAHYWAAALAADLTVVVINMAITVVVFLAFGFPVFVARSNLPAICLLILLYGYACSCLVHVLEKLFTEASLANMVMFCGNSFVGLAGITLLLILDVISDSDATDHARWVLHKVLLLCPQFVLGDGMLEIAKNTIQAQVLNRFGMDTYKDPLSTDLIAYHYIALVLVGTALLLLNLAIEYDCFESILVRFRSESITEAGPEEMEDLEVAAERKRVHVALYEAERPVRLPTIGNINAGFVDTEVKHNSIKRHVSTACDVAQCEELGKSYPALGGRRVAVRGLTLGVPAGQCTALLGQNGAGKSTTFSMLVGELRPSAGRVYLNQKPVTPRGLCQGLISYCPQTDAIDPLLTVRETLTFYCRLRGIEERDEVIKRTLEMFDLRKYCDVRSGALSGGNRRKLCTAVAFMGRTPLVLLDEPTSGMDVVSRGCVSRGVCMSCGAGRGVLLSTHALCDARRVANRVALMRAGRLAALTSIADCLTRFGGGYVVSCRVRGPARRVWRAVKEHAPQARLQVLHHAAIHFLMPLQATVNKTEVSTRLSDIFRMMAQLQTVCDIDDYTVNQTSLDQMFLSFTDKGEELEPLDLEPLPSVTIDVPQSSDDLNSITSL